MASIRLDIAEFVKDVRNGLSEQDLIRKHGLDSSSLQRVIKKLTEDGKLNPTDFRARQDPSGTRIAWLCPACGKPQLRVCDVCPECGVIQSKYEQVQSRKGEQEEKRARVRKEREEEQARQEEARIQQTQAAAARTRQLRQEYNATPQELKKALYPYLTFYYRALQGAGAIAALACATEFYYTANSTYRVVMVVTGAALLVGCLIAAEAVRIFVDMASSLVRTNALLSQSNVILGQLLDKASRRS